MREFLLWWQSWRMLTFSKCLYTKHPKKQTSMREEGATVILYHQRTTKSFNRQLHKVTKAKSVFSTGNNLLMMLYMIIDITKKSTGRRQDWSRICAQLFMFFTQRMSK